MILKKLRIDHVVAYAALAVIPATGITQSDGVSDQDAALAVEELSVGDLEQALANKRRQVTQDELARFRDVIEIEGERAYKKPGQTFPWQLKCTSSDFRTIHGCLELRFFDPSARVYFDSGADEPDEVDIFNDGNLNVTVELASLYWPWRLGRGEYYDSWSFGPVVGAGLGTSGDDSEDGSQTSDAPVVVFSVGAMIEYKLESGASFAFELGRSTGFSSDESFGDIDDSATYVGIRIDVPLGRKPDIAD